MSESDNEISFDIPDNFEDVYGDPANDPADTSATIEEKFKIADNELNDLLKVNTSTDKGSTNKKTDDESLDESASPTNLDVLKDKIDKIFKMVSGDFAASIDKILKLIEKLKEQLKDKDNKCAGCSKLLKDAEIELKALKTTANQPDGITKQLANVSDDIIQTELMLNNSKAEMDLKLANNKVQNLQRTVNRISVFPKSQTTEDTINEKTKNEEDNPVNNINNELKEEELKLNTDYNKDIEMYNDIQKELNIKNKNLTTAASAEINGSSASLKRDIELKHILNTLNSKLRIIYREVQSINDITKETKNKESLLKKLFKHLTKLSVVLKSFTEYTTKINSQQIQILNIHNITNIITNNNNFFNKIKEFDFRKKIPQLTVNYYNNILNLIDDFVIFYNENIPILQKNITNNNDKLNTKISKIGGSHSKRNKTNKLKRRKSKKLKGKMLKKTTRNKRRRSKKH